MIAAESVMRGQNPSQEIQAQVLEALLHEAQFRTSLHRATKEYRCHLAGVLLDEAFNTAWRRAAEIQRA